MPQFWDEGREEGTFTSILIQPERACIRNDMFAGDWYPVQVKQKDKVGRPDVDQFEAVMAREDRQRGFFVSFDYTSDAIAECNAFRKKTGRIIKLITVKEILDEQHTQKM